MEQYLSIKEKHKDAILFFRLGDFYEMFFEDAKEASKILEIALTGKSCGLQERAPMCGIPYHSCEGYIQKLIEAGKKVAICEQMEDPKMTKGLVKREVIRIITPGTFINEKLIGSFQNNYILSVELAKNKEVFSIAYVDASTGELNVSHVNYFDFGDMFYKISPSELIVNKTFVDFINSREKLARQIKNYIQVRNICVNVAELNLDEVESRFFEQSYLEKIDLNEPENLQIKLALRSLLGYLEYTQKVVAGNLNVIHWVYQNRYLKLDYSSVASLELMESYLQKNKKYSLFGILDVTKTPMGGRTLRKWIEHPLRDKREIEHRLDIVEECISDYALREDLRSLLDSVYDMERICAKISYDTVSARDFINLKESAFYLPEILEKIEFSQKNCLIGAFEELDVLQDICVLLEKAISDTPSSPLREGEIIRQGYSQELDELRKMEKNSASVLAKLESSEREKTGIRSLKIGYNKVFGYYIEITHAALKNGVLPQEYIRKQTLANAERYINEELKELENKILTSRQKAMDLQNELYQKIKEEIKGKIIRIQKTAEKIGELDTYLALATVSHQNNYVKPVLNYDRKLEIIDGRHPVVEQLVEDCLFVPNNTNLNEKEGFMIITGPNMGGKSTYMRQVALISIMAHMGCYIPAKSGNIPIFDAIYTRVGAADDLSQGQSTFMVEMNEVSHILEHATKDSLVILDEIGRGTSTYDGMSIAWAIIGYICSKINCMTLFSTHYHEITDIEHNFQNVVNYCVAVEERQDEVIFLKKVVRGKADKSYGIHVAHLAELPQEVLDGAQQKLEQLQIRESMEQENATIPISQRSFFSLNEKDPIEQKVCHELKELNADTLTPIEALLFIMKLKEELQG